MPNEANLNLDTKDNNGQEKKNPVQSLKDEIISKLQPFENSDATARRFSKKELKENELPDTSGLIITSEKTKLVKSMETFQNPAEFKKK